ncbi:hypothetical protein CSUI_001930 [Cystoisospora suis]|uniref:Uncharacterized protein n=1 Tax=Cystoisospora suis TaxID=483139 RepID=A0A2C6KJJ4_9APIC|nr:hypothetical protein CSUI_001930 [Cystoisospora suis]
MKPYLCISPLLSFLSSFNVCVWMPSIVGPRSCLHSFTLHLSVYVFTSCLWCMQINRGVQERCLSSYLMSLSLVCVSWAS